MAEIKPYQIAVSDAQLKDLKVRLSLARFPDELDGTGWEMGAPLADVKRISRHWMDGFDWRRAEAKMNKLPNFVTDIQCEGFEPLAIHFVHEKSKVPGAIPLLFIHGWPGSFLEVTKILTLLTEGSKDHHGHELPAFDVVAPSLPNFGFSEGTKKRGFAPEQYAETLNKLMLKLGYDQYVTQGGDWGCHLSRTLSHLYPQHCKATHLNMDAANQPPSFFSTPLLAAKHAVTPYSERDRAKFARTAWFDVEGRGYNLQQSTKPQTLAYALTDSPVSCLSWIYEKMHDWADDYPWTDDEVCTWVSVYWYSVAGPGAAGRIYYETVHNVDGRADKMDFNRMRTWVKGGVKIGCSHFPQDLHVFPTSWAHSIGEVVFQRDHESGGHFAAWELPEVLVGDVRDMFGKGGGAYGVVEGRTGYPSSVL